MSDEIFKPHPAEREAEEILNDPNPLERVKKHLDNIIAGEDNNKKAIFILLLSGLKWVPAELKQMILLKGESGAGKSHLMKIADLFNTKTVGRFTKHALDYTDLENYEILKLREIGYMDQEEQGVSTIKFLSADDMGYEVEITERGENGRWTTVQRRIPPITVITSTTRVDLESQFERRAWIFNPDESPEQTERIRQWKVRHEYEKVAVTLGKREMTSYDYSVMVLKALIRKLEPCVVIVPYVETLFKMFDTRNLRIRGDYDKILAAIKLYGILLQRVESHKKINGTLFVAPSPRRAFEVLNVIRGPLTAMQMGLEARTRRLILPLKDAGITEAGAKISKEDRERIALDLGLSESTIRKYLNEWVKRGYLSSDGKRPATYTLLLPLSEIESRLHAIVTYDFTRLEREMVEEMRKVRRMLLA